MTAKAPVRALGRCEVQGRKAQPRADRRFAVVAAGGWAAVQARAAAQLSRVARDSGRAAPDLAAPAVLGSSDRKGLMGLRMADWMVALAGPAAAVEDQALAAPVVKMAVEVLGSKAVRALNAAPVGRGWAKEVRDQKAGLVRHLAGCAAGLERAGGKDLPGHAAAAVGVDRDLAAKGRRVSSLAPVVRVALAPAGPGRWMVVLR